MTVVSFGRVWDIPAPFCYISVVGQELYETAAIDGANRWQQTIHITNPEISSSIIMLILKYGTMLVVGIW